MNIATHNDWRSHRLDIGLLEENLPGLVAELLDLGLGQRFTLEQLGDLPVQVPVVKATFHFR